MATAEIEVPPLDRVRKKLLLLLLCGGGAGAHTPALRTTRAVLTPTPNPMPADAPADKLLLVVIGVLEGALDPVGNGDDGVAIVWLYPSAGIVK